MGDRGEAGECPRIVWDGSELDWVDPRGRRLYLRGVGWDFLAEWPFNEAHKRILREYRPQRIYRLALFIPCAYGKPYSQSYIHYLIRRVTAPYIRAGLIHEIILTNAGVVPRELDEYWPYTAYDWNPLRETGEIRECYRRVLEQRITEYLRRFSDYYRGYAAYLRTNSDSWKALERAASRLGLKIENYAPHSVPEEEIREAGLGLGYEEDPDLILVTRTALNSLAESLKEKLGALLEDEASSTG